MIFKKDNFVFGIALGIIAPIIGFLLYKLVKFKALSNIRNVPMDEDESQPHHSSHQCFLNGQCNSFYYLYQWIS